MITWSACIFYFCFIVTASVATCPPHDSGAGKRIRSVQGSPGTPELLGAKLEQTEHSIPYRGTASAYYMLVGQKFRRLLMEAEQCLTIHLLRQNSSFPICFAKFSFWWGKCCTLMLNYLSTEEVPICACEWWLWGPSPHCHMQPLSVCHIQNCANMCEGIWCLIWFDGILIMTSIVFECRTCPLMSPQQQQQCKYK